MIVPRNSYWHLRIKLVFFPLPSKMNWLFNKWLSFKTNESSTFSLFTEIALAFNSRRASPFDARKLDSLTRASTMDNPSLIRDFEIIACGTPSKTAKKSSVESCCKLSLVAFPKRISDALIAASSSFSPCTRLVMSSASAFCKIRKWGASWCWPSKCSISDFDSKVNMRM